MTRYLDLHAFDELQDWRAEQSIGTGTPVTLDQAIQAFQEFSPGPPPVPSWGDSLRVRACDIDYSCARAAGTNASDAADGRYDDDV